MNNHTYLNTAISQIKLINSGADFYFTHFMNTNKQIELKYFGQQEFEGIFFACLHKGTFRIYIAFDDDTNNYNIDIAKLIRTSMQASGSTSCKLWFKNENRKIINFIKNEFNLFSHYHDYASVEYIINRKEFTKRPIAPLITKAYEPENLDKYLNLLDESMTFASPPANFRGNRSDYDKKFNELSEKKMFETFWLDENIVGLYWLDGNCLDLLAVAPLYQRKGFGTMILSRALERAFENSSCDIVELYAVDWNEKANNFYKKFGMKENAHSYMLEIKKVINIR